MEATAGHRNKENVRLHSGFPISYNFLRPQSKILDF